MATLIAHHHECEHCGSSDAASTYMDDDGRRFTQCFSCSRVTQLDPKFGDSYRMEAIELPTLVVPEDHPFIKSRGLHVDSLLAYGAGFDGDTLWMPSYVDGFPIFAKLRARGKKFWSVGALPHHFGLYGWQSPSTKKHVLIVEGEADAWAAYQMMEGRMTVLSVPLGVKDAVARVKNDLPLLEQFERIYVMFDNDSPGQEAQRGVVSIINPALTYPVIGREGFKDASDYLKAGEIDLFREVVYAAQHIVPPGFTTPEERAQRALRFFQDKDAREGISFGYPGLDGMMGGQRPGEVITWVGGTGSGKSSLMRALLGKLYEQQVKTLYVPLEDLPEAVDILLAQLVLGEDYIHTPTADPEKLVETVLNVAQYIEVLQGGEVNTPQDVLHRFEYAVRQRDARVIILDHVTWLAEASGDATKTLQQLMPLIKQLAVKLGVTVHLVSHLNRDKADKDDTAPNLARLKHSAAVAQASDAVVGLSGDRDNNELTAAMLKQSRLWGRTDTTEVTFEFTTAGRIVEAEWEDRLEDIDNAEEEAPTETRRVEKRVRSTSASVEPEAGAGDDVRTGGDSVPDDAPGEEVTRLSAAQRSSGGAEGEADGGGEAAPIVVPPALETDGGDYIPGTLPPWARVSDSLPSK